MAQLQANVATYCLLLPTHRTVLIGLKGDSVKKCLNIKIISFEKRVIPPVRWVSGPLLGVKKSGYGRSLLKPGGAILRQAHSLNMVNSPFKIVKQAWLKKE